MVDERVKELRKLNNKWKDMNEEQVKISITIRFLELFGYDKYNFEYNKKIGKGFCDIWVNIGRDEGLIIEVKNSEHALTSDDIAQVHQYAKVQGQEYAILTNGYEYVLLNFSNIKPAPRLTEEGVMMSYVVLWFNIFKATGEKLSKLSYIDYLSFENMYNKRVTSYFCDIAQYRELKKKKGMSEKSWMAYECTLLNFFDFFSKKCSRYAYERIFEEDFNEFIATHKRHGMETSIKTIENNYTHIYDMLLTLKNDGKITTINLEGERHKGVENFQITEKKKKFAPISAEEIKKALEFYSNRKNSSRNCAIFLMVATLGIERSQILNLKWSDFDDKIEYIFIDKRKIKICQLLKYYLKKLNEEKNKYKIKSEYIFLVLYRNEYRQISEWGINDVFNELAGLDDCFDWKSYSPKYIRNCLIVTMFEQGYSIEEIIYVTGIDINNLSKYITMDMIINRTKRTIKWEKLYNGILCEENL